MKQLVPVCALAALCGCSTLTSTPPEVDTRGTLPAETRPVYNLAGYPPAFKDGYIDGCETAKGSRFGWKNPKRFESDAQYKQGWSDGFDICKKR